MCSFELDYLSGRRAGTLWTLVLRKGDAMAKGECSWRALCTRYCLALPSGGGYTFRSFVNFFRRFGLHSGDCGSTFDGSYSEDPTDGYET